MYCKYEMENPYDLIHARSDGSHEYARIRCTQEFHDLRYTHKGGVGAQQRRGITVSTCSSASAKTDVLSLVHHVYLLQLTSRGAK